MSLFKNVGIGARKLIEDWLKDKELEFGIKWIDSNNRFNYKSFMYITQFYSVDTLPSYIQFNNTTYNFDQMCGFHLKMQQIIADPNTKDIIGDLNKYVLCHFPLLTGFTIIVMDEEYTFTKKYGVWNYRKRIFKKSWDDYDVIDEARMRLYTGNKISQKKWKNQRNYIY